MDISTYWQTVKKQSKELTGVKKISAGVFHGSGIGSSLEDYIKAVKSEDPKKIKKEAASALKKTESYLNTIHKKELATGKKAMTAPQLKSAKIVGDALDKIVDQLKDVVSGKSEAGSFDRDGDKDVYDKVMGKAEAHIDLRNKVAKDALGYLNTYKKLAAQAPKLVQMGQKYAKAAETAKKSSNMQENMNAVSLAQRVVGEVQSISDKITKHYKANIQSDKSDFMICRQDFAMNTVPKQYLAEYKKRHNAAWKPVAQAGDAINKLRHELQANLESVMESADTAEGFSMMGKDPEVQIAKIEDIEKAANKIFGDAGLAVKRIAGAVDILAKAIKNNTPLDALEKAVNIREPDIQKRLSQYKEGLQSAKKLKSRVDSLAKGTEGDAVIQAAKKAKAPLENLEKMAPKVSSDYKKFTALVTMARKKIEAGENV